MEGEEEGGLRLSKRFNDNNKGGEVDYKTKAGTAWSHSYLNQKPWHPLSYPNQRRKWIAEQTHAQRQRRGEEVAREYAKEQEFFRQTALFSKKEKEKIEMMKAVSFMYVRPPGYNAESAKAAEVGDEVKKQNQDDPTTPASSSVPSESIPREEKKKKPRPKDVFGRPLPTEEEFQVLANAPRMETGVPARVKPFGIEVRNVKCLRCGNFGHQSGDRECPLKDAMMPNEESRLRRDDPLTAIMAHTDPSEPLKWELKQKPGRSPPRGGFDPDDPNQQIVADDIFDEYGGFLSGGNIPDLLTNFSPNERRKKSKKSKCKRKSSLGREFEASEENGLVGSPPNKGKRRSKKEKKKKMAKEWQDHSESSSSRDLESDKHSKKNRRFKHSYSSDDYDYDKHHRSKKNRQTHYYSSESDSDSDSDSDRHHRSKNSRKEHSYGSQHFSSDRHCRSVKRRHKRCYSPSSDDSGSDMHYRSKHDRSQHHSHHRHHQSDSYSE